MAHEKLYLGIDLGTTNSAAAVFDGSQVNIVRSAQGSSLTPSVVRIDARGNVLVGERARRFLETDANNTRTEFKRLMGSPQQLQFPASKQSRTPVELSAEVLSALRKDVAAQIGSAPDHAVISVPALFELPQTSATSEAARLAGFTRVEFIQEPVASAIAAGWSSEESTGAWLVYDLGGGTFDVSLLDTQEGLLRVVGHDGDNFLGGRDLDSALVDLMIADLAPEGVLVDRANPAHAGALRRLRLAAEEVKIELSREPQAVADFNLDVDGALHPVCLTIERARAEQCMRPLIERTVEICQRLLERHGVKPEELGRIVLVGGPTVIPTLRRQVQDALRAPFNEGLDPMTLVAQGAALFAASAGLPAFTQEVKIETANRPRLWLQFPTVTSDPTPFVLGKLLASDSGIQTVRITRADGAFQSEDERIAEDGTFAMMVTLTARKTSEFRVEGVGAAGELIAVEPATISIAHGLTLGEPPLARSIGIALADDSVKVYLERGSPLPARRTFTHRTADNATPSAPGFALRIPIVQGEFAQAHLCRLVGVLEIASERLKAPLPAGSAVEVTVNVDRGGCLQTSARISALDQVFDEVAQLIVPQLSQVALEDALRLVRERLSALRQVAADRVSASLLVALPRFERDVAQAAQDVAAARGGDPDAVQKAARRLGDLDALFSETEAGEAWPEVEAKARHSSDLALGWVGMHGNVDERAAFQRANASLEQALRAKNASEVDRQLGVIRRLGAVTYFREPGAWEHELSRLEGELENTTDPKRARVLLQQGRRAQSSRDASGLQTAVRELWQLQKDDRTERAMAYDSGVR